MDRPWEKIGKEREEAMEGQAWRAGCGRGFEPRSPCVNNGQGPDGDSTATRGDAADAQRQQGWTRHL